MHNNPHLQNLPPHMRPWQPLQSGSAASTPMSFDDGRSDTTSSVNLSQVSSSTSSKKVRFDPARGVTKETVIGDDSPDSPPVFQLNSQQVIHTQPQIPRQSPQVLSSSQLMINGHQPQVVARSLSQQSSQVHPVRSASSTGTVRTAASSDGLVNGKVLATIGPERGCCPWTCPPRYDPYKMPKVLLQYDLTTARPTRQSPAPAAGMFYVTQQMPVEDYTLAVETLTNDSRFKLYCCWYRRIITFWLLLGLIILVPLCFALAKTGLVLLGAIIAWFFVLAIGLFVCLWIKKKLHRGLHHAVKRVNEILYKYDLLIGVDDQGRFSCKKVYIHFMYFHCQDCLPRIAQLVQQSESTTSSSNDRSVRYTVPVPASEIQESANRKATYLLVKYSQSYIKNIIRRRLRFPTRPAEGVSELTPLHCAKHYCICQFIQKRHFEHRTLPFYERWFFMDDLTIAELESRSTVNRTPNAQYPQTLVYARN